MALSDDQRALLRLLAKREEGYEDIAALKGLSVEQVRAEVADALAELQAAGEAPPPPRADAPEPSPPPQSAPAPAETKSEPAPEATVAETETPIAPPKAAPQAKTKPRSGRPALPAERRRLVLLTGGALAVVAVVLIAITVFGGDSGSDSTTAGSSGAETTASESENDKVTQAVLTAADGSDASGRAVFGRVGKEEIVLQVTAEGLEPTDTGQSYTVWLYRTPKLTLRVGSVPVGDTGRLGARFTIPAELLAYVASGAFTQIYISRTDNAAYQQEVARAKQNKTLPRYIGETVLTGEITGPVAKGGEGG